MKNGYRDRRCDRMSGRSTFVVLVSQGEEYSRRGGVAVDTVTKALVEALGAGGGAKTPRSKGRFEFIGAETNTERG